MRQTIKSVALAERFRMVVHGKLHEAMELPGAVQNCACDKGHGFASFFLSGPHNSAVVSHDSLGNHLVIFSNTDATVPAYDLQLEDDDVLAADFAGDTEDLPDIIEQFELLESLHVMINELVPYGWVDGDRIIAIIWVGTAQGYEIDGVTANLAGLYSYVLDGEVMPNGLKMYEDDTLNDWHEDWRSRIWDLIKRGSLVRLTDRINNLPGEIVAESDGSGTSWVRFESNDGEKPEFVTEAHYRTWHPKETEPGEFSRKLPSQSTAYSNPLRGYFR